MVVDILFELPYSNLPFVFLYALEMIDRRVEVVGRLKALEESAAPLIAFLQNPNAVQELRADRQHNLQLLNDRYKVFA